MTTHVDSLVREQRAAQTAWHERAWSGVFSRDITNMANKAFVVIPAFDEEKEWGPCPWQSRDATSLPAKGDDCLVQFDERRQLWVIAWWPY